MGTDIPDKGCARHRGQEEDPFFPRHHGTGFDAEGQRK